MPASKRNRGKLRRLGSYAAASLLAAAAAVRLAMAFAGWWIDCGDEPVRSDALVVLAGGYARFPHAADLYARGYAPQVWISRPRRPPLELLLDDLGVRLPRESAVNEEILLKKGVPKGRIRPFGLDVNSTADEADAFAREFDADGKRVLVVTSRFHARRARLIFRRRLRGARVLVAATPYERFTRRWWTDKDLAQSTLLELCKLAYYLAGGRFVAAAT